MLRKKISEEWTDKHRNVMRKLVVDGGVQTKIRHWLVRRKEMSRMQQGRGDGEAQTEREVQRTRGLG